MDQAASLRQMYQIDKYNESPYNLIKEEKTVDRYAKNRHVKDRYAKVITVTSGKGGVGKTFISVNLAMALSRIGKRVLLFDADICLANVNILLGIVPEFNLYHYFNGKKSLEDIKIKINDQLDIIVGTSGGYSSLFDLSEEQRKKIVESFNEIGNYNYIIIDTGAGINDDVLKFVISADKVYVVTTPEPTSITDAYGIIKSIAVQSNIKEINLIINKVESVQQAKRVGSRIESIARKFLKIETKETDFIFNDKYVPMSIIEQKPISYIYPKSKASNCINTLASNIIFQDMNEKSSHPRYKLQNHVNGKGGLGSFFQKLFQQY